MRPRIRPKRRSVRGVGLALMVIVALVSGLLGSPASAQEDPDGDGPLPPGEWTEEQANALSAMVTEAEQKLPEKFSDANQLESMGYVDIIAVSGGYSHYVNVDLFDDEHLFNPEFPESLVYRRTAAGEELAAAMYFHNTGITMDNIPEEDAWLPGWHAHPELCSNDRGQVVGGTIPGSNLCPAGSSPAVGPPMIHTWIIDPGCGHRFGGVGVGGVNCDVYHHDDHGDEGDEGDEPAPPEEECGFLASLFGLCNATGGGEAGPGGDCGFLLRLFGLC